MAVSSQCVLAHVIVFVAAASAAIDEHAITALPGWPKEIPLPKMYSGYLPVGSTNGVSGHIHYWFINAKSNPETAPVVYWTNGGPGGSGINAGLLTEMGRVHVNEASNTSEGIELFDNEYAWNNVANMLYVSQPKGVGFSYCDDADKCENNDIISAEDFYDFIVAFFEAYPEYKTNDLYLTAESYGGIYIPMFMDQIDQRGGVPNLKGVLLNGYLLDNDACS